MKDLIKLIDAFTKYGNDIINDNDNDNVKVYDLTTDEGIKGYNKQLDELSETDLDFLNDFGIDAKKLIKEMRNLGNHIYESNKEDETPVQQQLDRKTVDHTDTEKIERPSDKLSVDQKLQLHKITQEYVDTMIKPYNKGQLTNNQINDAYAGLFEFAAWIMKR